MPTSLHDPSDPRLDPFRKLPERANGTETIVAESELAVSRWLASPHVVRGVLTTSERWPRLEPLVGDDVDVFLAPIQVIRAVVGFPLRRGVVAWGPRPQVAASGSQEVLRVVVAEGLSDPTNLGALVRNCRAFGVHQLVVAGGADPYCRRAIRASAGHCFELPIHEQRVDAALARLSDARWIATSPQGELRLSEVEPGPRWVLVVGHEGAGISAELLERCATRVRIPLASGVDSLNVAAATAVCLSTLCPEPS